MNFVKGAWLFTLDKELTEDEFIEKAGGMSKLKEFQQYPFVSLVLDDKPKLVGHYNGRTIALAMGRHKLWQTMEWK